MSKTNDYKRPWQNETSTIATGNLSTEQLANVISRINGHLVQVIAQRDNLLAALRELVEVNERIGAPAITQGGLCEEQDWAHDMRQARAAIAAAEGSAS